MDRKHYLATKDTHRLCRRCQYVMTADPEQVCAACRGTQYTTHACPVCGDVHLPPSREAAI